MTRSLNIKSLGLVAESRRKIKPGLEFEHFFSKPVYEDPVLYPSMDVEQVLKLMAKIVSDHSHETKKLSDYLLSKSTNTFDYCKNVWHWVYDHIQYALDTQGVEELRTPNRTWADRKSGVDCDCMSIFVATLLENAGVKYEYVVTKYGKNDWQHVYVVAKDEKGRRIIIDTVMDQFDKEKPPSDIWKFSSISGKTLNGVSENNNNNYNNNSMRHLGNEDETTTAEGSGMIAWVKANPITSSAIAVVAASAGYVAFDAFSKKTKSGRSLTGRKPSTTKKRTSKSLK